MSFVMNALSQYRAVLGVNNAQYASMQGKQNMMSRMNSASPNFGKAQMDSFVSSDKSFAMDQAKNNLQAQACNVELDSLEKAKKRQVEGFNYFR